MNPNHICTPYFPKIHFNIILTPVPRSLQWYLPFRFSYKNVVCIPHLSYVGYLPCPSHFWKGIELITISPRDKSSDMY
jgi:hypothetical protein